MFFRRRRLQVLLSLLLIVCSALFLLGQLNKGRSGTVRPDSQLSEALFLLRHNYVRPLDETPLLESAVLALQAEAKACGLENQLPKWRPLPRPPGEEGVAKVEQYLAEVAALEPSRLAPQKAMYVAISGMLAALSDPYTFVMDPKEYADFGKSLHTHIYGGVGLEVEWTRGAHVVFSVSSNSPAAAAKIRAGDRILAVDGIETAPPGRAALTPHHVRALLSGEVGKEVRLKLAREGAVYQRTLTFAKFESRSVLGRLVKEPGAPPIGWLSLRQMGQQSGQEMLDTLAALQKQGAQGYVIDLRDNVGGYLNAAVEIASCWLVSGQSVVTIEGRSGEKSRHTIGVRPSQASLVVLVNGRTASSAEILAASLREHGRAYILGETTFGKGSVQTLYDFVDGGGLKMTTATYLTPSGKALEGRGLTPDHKVDVSQGRDEAAIRQDVIGLCRELWKKDPSAL